MAAAPDTIPTAVAVIRTSLGRGTQHFTYSGTSADAVLAAALRAWKQADPWLRGLKPATYRDDETGVFCAHLTVWSAS